MPSTLEAASVDRHRTPPARRHRATRRDGQVAVMGGYGAVGRHVVAALAARPEVTEVVVAGRSAAQAERTARAHPGRARAAVVDVADGPSVLAALDGSAVAVACVPDDHGTLARSVLARGVHLVDISATTAHVRALQALAPVARAAGASGVVGVGLAPGVTNLLAADLATQLDDVEHVELSVMLGLGEQHGHAALRWTLEQLARPFPVAHRGPAALARPFTDGRRTVLAGRPRRGFRLDFADQHLLLDSLGARSAATRLCFDSAAATRLLAASAATGALGLLRRPRAREAAAAALTGLHAGTDAYAVRAEVTGMRAGERVRLAREATGHGQSSATALVAALVATRLLRGDAVPGVSSIERAMDASWALSSLARGGMRLGPSHSIGPPAAATVDAG